MMPQWDAFGAALPLAWRAVAVLAAGGAVAVQLALPLPMPAVVASDSEPMPGRAAARPIIRQDAAYPAIAEHPLFAPDRRPWMPPPPPAPAPADNGPGPLAEYRLVGIVVSDGVRRALVKPARDGKTIVLSEGEQLDGWTLREIAPRRLRFTAQDASYDMSFRGAPESGE